MRDLSESFQVMDDGVPSSEVPVDLQTSLQQVAGLRATATAQL